MIDLYTDLERMLNLAGNAVDDPGSYHSDVAVRELSETVQKLAIDRDGWIHTCNLLVKKADDTTVLLLVEKETVLQLQAEAIRLSAENRALRLRDGLSDDRRQWDEKSDDEEKERHRARFERDERELSERIRADRMERELLDALNATGENR